MEYPFDYEELMSLGLNLRSLLMLLEEGEEFG